jgi:hypothetical protein
MPYASSSLPIVPSEGTEVEGAGMGKIVQLKEKLSVSQIVSMVKQHLSLEFGLSLSLTTPYRPADDQSSSACRTKNDLSRALQSVQEAVSQAGINITI